MGDFEYNKRVHSFAKKWREKFENENSNYIELVDRYMSDECFSLGFKMDCGEAFSKEYGSAINDYRELEKVIGKVKDIDLLGSAIFSQWRYFNHWAYSGAEILEHKNRKWFIIALNRMAELSNCSNTT